MNTFIVIFSAILIIVEILSVYFHLSVLNQPQYAEAEKKRMYIRKHRDIFGINDHRTTQDSEAIIVLTPEQLGLR